MHRSLNLLVVFILVSFSSSCMMLQADAMLRHAKADGPFDAVIIPGVPYQDSSLEDMMHLRVRWAVYLYENGIAKNLIFSGSAVYTPYYESKVMGAMAHKLGVPTQNIFFENKAEHSTENLYYGYHLAKSLGFQRIALASDPLQTYLLSEANESLKVDDISFLPFNRSFIRANSSKDKIIVDVEKAKVQVLEEFIALPDRKTPTQRFKGTLGRKIKNEIRMNKN